MEHRAWVSRYREELKGLAILWVVFFHTRLNLPGSLDMLRGLGYGGVDIFLFLLGMGLYRSLRKNDALDGYMKRRFARILPAYLPLLLLWVVVTYPMLGLSRVQVLRGLAGNLFMDGYWMDAPRVYNWYANAQFLYFLIVPVYFAFLVRSKKPLRTLIALMVVSIGVGVTVIGQRQIMGMSRLPVLLLGVAFGMDWPVSRKRGLARAGYLAAAALGLAVLIALYDRSPILLNDFGLYWYAFALIAPGLCVGLAFLFHKADKARAAFAPLRLVGESSFEVYLINAWLYDLAKEWHFTGVWPWLAVMAASVALGLLYHLLVKACVKGWKARHPKTQALDETAGEVK